MYNSPCTDVNGNPLPGYQRSGGLRGATGTWPTGTTFRCSRPTTLPAAARCTTTVGHTDVKELALYLEDQIKARNWLFNLGIRGDLYNGLAIATPGRAARGHRL